MANLRTETKRTAEARTFEQTLLNAGYVERIGATSSTLLPHEYTKRNGSTDPNSFSGSTTVTFEIREA